MLEASRAEPKDLTRRMRAMRKTVAENDVSHWASTFLEELAGDLHTHSKSTRPARRS